MTLSEFNEVVLNRFSQEITDQVFLMIEGDRELMQLYLDAVSETNTRAVNSHLAKAIKERYGLDGNGVHEMEPRSKLIKSHEEF